MPSFTHRGVELAYDDIKPAASFERTIVMVHGLASSKGEGWRRTGWYNAFERRGYRVVALDQRGHGESQKLYAPTDYLRRTMAEDLVGLLDHLELSGIDLLGYSMGSGVSLEAALLAPGRIANLILGGVGDHLLDPPPELDPEVLAQGMLAPDVEAIEDEMAQSFRIFAEEQDADLKALAACLRAPSPVPDVAAFATLTMPVLVVAGDGDEPAGDYERLASMFPRGVAATVRGCDHFSAMPNAMTKAAVFDFLDGMLDPDFPQFG